MKKPQNHNLTSWYFNIRRVAEVVGSDVLADMPSLGRRPLYEAEPSSRSYVLAALKEAFLEWVKVTNPQTLGTLLIQGEARPGVIFTHYSDFYSVGLSKYCRPNEKPKKNAKLPYSYSKLDAFRKGLRVRLDFHPDHLVSMSSWGMFSGRKPFLVFGLIEEVNELEIVAKPYIMGSLISGFGNKTFTGSRWRSRLELHIDEIDSFSRVRNDRSRYTRKHLNILRDIPESEIKSAFAEIIGEPVVPKDWGGETSDLFSSRLRIDGKRRTASFIFKGPSKFSPMAMAELGKNGDQIPRLLSEHSDVMVLQHCHEVTPFVRATLRAFASNIRSPRLFLVVDGYDTLRLLNSYGKCGVRKRLRAIASRVRA